MCANKNPEQITLSGTMKKICILIIPLIPPLFVTKTLFLSSTDLVSEDTIDIDLPELRNSFLTSDSQDTLLVITQQETLIQLSIYLPLQFPFSPAIIYCFQLIILSLIFIWNRDKQFILRPIQLRIQRVRNWIDTIEVHTTNRILPCRSDNIPHFIIEVLYILYLVHTTKILIFFLDSVSQRTILSFTL